MVEPGWRVVSVARFQMRAPSFFPVPPRRAMILPAVSVMTKADWGFSSLRTVGKS